MRIIHFVSEVYNKQRISKDINNTQKNIPKGRTLKSRSTDTNLSIQAEEVSHTKRSDSPEKKEPKKK